MQVEMVSMRFTESEMIWVMMLCRIHMTDAVREACHVSNVVISFRAPASHAAWPLEPSRVHAHVTDDSVANRMR